MSSLSTQVFILEELLSPIVTPFILIFLLRNKSLEIIDFFRNFTVEVVGVGDICSFAQMDIRRHGNPTVRPIPFVWQEWMNKCLSEWRLWEKKWYQKGDMSIDVFSVAVRRTDRGICVPAGWKWQNGAVPHAFHHKESTVAAPSGELSVYQPFKGEGAPWCTGRPLHSAAALRGASLHLAAVQRVWHWGRNQVDNTNSKNYLFAQKWL